MAQQSFFHCGLEKNSIYYEERRSQILALSNAFRVCGIFCTLEACAMRGQISALCIIRKVDFLEVDQDSSNQRSVCTVTFLIVGPSKSRFQQLPETTQMIAFTMLLVSVTYCARFGLLQCVAKFDPSGAQKSWIFQENTNELKPVKERINKHKVKTLKIVLNGI